MTREEERSLMRAVALIGALVLRAPFVPMGKDDAAELGGHVERLRAASEQAEEVE